MQMLRSTPNSSAWTTPPLMSGSNSGRSFPLSSRTSPPLAAYFCRISPPQIGTMHRQSTARATRTKALNEGGNDGRIPPQEFIYKFLTEKELKSISPQVAFDLVATGSWEIVDVRPKDSHAEATPQGAKSAPLFQKVDWSKPSFVKVLRAGALMANGVTPVEPNPKFLEDLSEAASGKGVILACEAGGSIRPTSSFAFGKASRSLSAAYSGISDENSRCVRRALSSGRFETSRVLHLEGGVFGWYQAKLPFDGEFDTSNVGRTPNAAADAQYPVNVKK